MKSTSLMKHMVGVLVVVSSLLVFARPASASFLVLTDPATGSLIDIGTLSFNLYDPSFPEFGGQVGIANLSAGLLGIGESPFENITLELQLADLSLLTYGFGTLSPSDLPSFILGGAGQTGFTFSNLGAAVTGNTIALDVPDVSQLASVYLSLLFQSTLIQGTSLGVASVLTDGDFAPIQYPTPVASVPEPGTLLLVGCGVALAAIARRKQARRPAVTTH